MTTLTSPSVTSPGVGASPTSAQAGLDLVDAWSRMLAIRTFENGLASLVGASYDVSRYVHLCTGHEAVAVGVCAAARAEDWMTTTYRGHGVVLARGGSPRRALEEVLARPTGYLAGRAGSMHLAAPDLRIIDAAGIVGGNLPIAVGAALRALVCGEGEVAVCFFGDGATATGAFHESLNIAALWRLPVLFVCENNGRSVRTDFATYSSVPTVSERASAYGMPAFRVDGADVSVVTRTAEQALSDVRAGGGPALLECEVTLLGEHFAIEGVAAGTCDVDPLTITQAQLLGRPGLSDRWLAERAADIERQVRAVFANVEVPT